MVNEIHLIDDESLRRVTEYNLLGAGFTVRSADGFVQGLEMFKVKAPDLVVTDVQLGDGFGLDLLSRFSWDCLYVSVVDREMGERGKKI